ncbi:MAG: hypothetical protein AB7S75_09235 [Desulfococcaceae bacterium]
MKNDLHTFHIPVMGLGHSADTPIRVAPFGISSVISIVEDFLLEKIRHYYCGLFDLPPVPIGKEEADGRARRITAWLNTVKEIVEIKMEKIKSLPFFAENDKKKYFDLLPEESPLKAEYNRLISMTEGPERDAAAAELTGKMRPGSIDVNIMVKLDNLRYDSSGSSLGDEFSDAKAALRGYAESCLESSIVFSAGINKSLFSYMSRFRDFYRDESGRIKKKIIIKVSDFRSALIQGRFLAKKGLEVYEYRIESGLNCGGHTFATNGMILPCVAEEFRKNRDQLCTEFRESIAQYYAEKGWKYAAQEDSFPLVTIQGGIGVHGEVRRLREDFGMDMCGWASPFLLVPEATPVDEPTRRILANARGKDLYLSNASPFGIPFSNVRRTGSELWTRQMAAEGKPGSSCPIRLLASNTEFSERPICTGSRQYQRRKLEQISQSDMSPGEKEQLCREITQKVCLCEHLGNGALIALGIAEEKDAPQCVCPGPNIEWFDRTYTLKEMVDHIYGRGLSLVSAERPHMFAKEIMLYADYFETLAKKCTGSPKEIKALEEFKNNLTDGISFCLEIAKRKPYPGENLASLAMIAERENKHVKSVYLLCRTKAKIKEMMENGITPTPELMGLSSFAA